MSLMKMLTKVAIGVAVAKGAKAVMNRKPNAGGSSQAGLGGLLGSLGGGAGSQSGGGGLQNMLGGLMGGAQGGGGAGLQGMLGGLMGGAPGGSGGAGTGASGGLGGLLENLGGGQSGGGIGGFAAAGGAGGLLGALGARTAQRPADNGATFGQVLNSNFDETPQDPIEPTADQEAAAALMLRAMIQAAKSDGEMDADEQEKIVGQMGGDVDPDEAAFIRAQMAAPVDVDALVADVPQGMGPQVYAMSVLAIDLDTQAEAQYLHKLAQGLGLEAEAVNNIHAELGVPSLYT